VNLRSPLSQVLGYGSAKDGTGHWWGQRVSAVGLIVLGLWFMISMLLLGKSGFSYPDVIHWLRRTPNSVMLLLLVITLAWHSYLGIQVIIEDYVHGPFVKVLSLITSRFVHVAVAITSVFAVLKIAFGAAA